MWAGTVFAKGEEENLQIKIGIVATYSRAESKSTYFSPIFLMKISFSEKKTPTYALHDFAWGWPGGGDHVHGQSLGYAGVQLLNIQFPSSAVKYSNRYLSDIFFLRNSLGQ